MDAPSNHKRPAARRAALLIAGLAAALPTSLAVGALASQTAWAAETLNQTFSFNDATQYFTVPAGVTSVTLTADGGKGGAGGPGTTIAGAGVMITENVPASPGDTLVVEVGGQGSGDSGNTGGAGGLSSGDGMNGGAGASTSAGVDGYGGGGGGGGTEVVDATTGAVLVVAAGGGGAGGDASYGGGSGPGQGNAAGLPGSGPYGAGGAGGEASASGALAGANGNTPNPATLSGGGGGGGGGYYVPSLYGGGGNGGAGGGWTSYESGGGGGGGGASYSSPFATGFTFGPNPGTNGEVVVSWDAPETPTTTSIALNPGSVGVNQTYNIDAFVSGSQSSPPTGLVQFSSDGKVMGTATLVDSAGTDEAIFNATAPSVPGTVSWQAEFLGDTGASGSPGDAPSTSETASETILGGTTTTLASDPNTCAVGETCPLEVTVTGSGPTTPTGRVSLDVNDVSQQTVTLNSAGQATFDIIPQTTVPVSYTAQYLGDVADSPSTSAPVEQSVVEGIVTVTIKAPKTVTPGKKYVVAAVVSGGGVSPTGTVKFASDGRIVGSVQIVPGLGTSEATLIAAAPKSGKVTWQGMYEGDTNYLPNVSPIVHVKV